MESFGSIFFQKFINVYRTISYFFQSIIFSLQGANNGGRIELSHSTFILHILPNDNPHGTIELAEPEFTLTEEEVETVQYIKVVRYKIVKRGG